MTAPEREALVKALLDEADDLRHAPSGDAKDEQNNYNWKDKPHRCLYDACKLVERAVAALSAPAVTVTEERVTRAVETLNNYTVSDRSPRSERDAVLEEAAVAVEHLAKVSSHAAMSMRSKPCRDRRDEDDYSRMAHTFDREKEVLKKAADNIRALKSTTPQTGSQE